MPPDVLNVNQIQKVGVDFTQWHENDGDVASFVSVGFNEVCSNNSNGSEEFEEGERNRNEWRDEGAGEQLPR